MLDLPTFGYPTKPTTSFVGDFPPASKNSCKNVKSGEITIIRRAYGRDRVPFSRTKLQVLLLTALWPLGLVLLRFLLPQKSTCLHSHCLLLSKTLLGYRRRRRRLPPPLLRRCLMLASVPLLHERVLLQLPFAPVGWQLHSQLSRKHI